jgi:hypothetical protein
MLPVQIPPLVGSYNFATLSILDGGEMERRVFDME